MKRTRQENDEQDQEVSDTADTHIAAHTQSKKKTEEEENRS